MIIIYLLVNSGLLVIDLLFDKSKFSNLEDIIKFLEKDQTPLPNSWRSKIQDEDSKKQIIVDYICGMTDQYAINFYNNYA